MPANLADANLSGADFTHANLFSADLRDANLSGADLTHANLSGADLGHCDLSNAYLFSATFNNTDLNDTNFLRDANFAGATFAYIVLVDVDLGVARGLDEVQHDGPSTIDHRTLERSGELPLAFLRGVGLPDEVIEFYRAQYEQPVQFYSCFISYAREDGEFVDRLYADLQDNGVRCWRDTEDMKIGDRQRPVIDRAIRLHDKVVLVLSERSIASDWVETEVETAFERERNDPQKRTVLFPVRLDDAIGKTEEAWARQVWDTPNVGDFRGWKDHDTYQREFQRVLRDLRDEDRPPAT